MDSTTAKSVNLLVLSWLFYKYSEWVHLRNLEIHFGKIWKFTTTLSWHKGVVVAKIDVVVAQGLKKRQVWGSKAQLDMYKGVSGLLLGLKTTNKYVLIYL